MSSESTKNAVRFSRNDYYIPLFCHTVLAALDELLKIEWSFDLHDELRNLYDIVLSSEFVFVFADISEISIPTFLQYRSNFGIRSMQALQIPPHHENYST